MARCAAEGIAHRGGLVRHGHARMYALDAGAVVRLSHPDQVAALAGDRTAEIAVLVVDGDGAAPQPGDFAAPRPGQLASATSYRQARSSHAFPVSDRDRSGLMRLVASAGQAAGEQPASMEQVQVETSRWIGLAEQVGVTDLKQAVATYMPAGGPPANGAAWIRTLVERQLTADGRLEGPRRRVAAPSSAIPEDRLSPALQRLSPRAGQRPQRRLRMLPPAAPASGDAVSHFELRVHERLTGLVGAGVQGDAAAGDDVAELADRIEQSEQELGGNVLARALPLVEELLTNPLHDVRFAYDACETSSRELATLQTNGASYARTTLVVDHPSGDPTRQLGIVVSVEPAPPGTSAADRACSFVRPVTCVDLPVDPDATTPMPVRDELRLGGYTHALKAVYGDDHHSERRLQRALWEVRRRRRRHVTAAAA